MADCVRPSYLVAYFSLTCRRAAKKNYQYLESLNFSEMIVFLMHTPMKTAPWL